MEENNIKVEINQKDFQKYVERLEEIAKKVDLIFSREIQNPAPNVAKDNSMTANPVGSVYNINPVVGNNINVTLKTEGYQPEKVKFFVEELNVLITRFGVTELNVKYKV